MPGTKKPRKNPTKSRTPILDSLDEAQAAHVLYLLTRSDPEIGKKAEEIARDFLEEVSHEEIADQVYSELDLLEIEEVWKSSGKQRYGDYIYPGERAHEMMEEVLAPFISEMEACLERGMKAQACEHCKGILLGLSRFEDESGSDLLEETPDSPSNLRDEVRESFGEGVDDPSLEEEMNEFCREEGC